jgi:uncharacterized protein YecT (DUF1311 family)
MSNYTLGYTLGSRLALCVVGCVALATVSCRAKTTDIPPAAPDTAISTPTAAATTPTPAAPPPTASTPAASSPTPKATAAPAQSANTPAPVRRDPVAAQKVDCSGAVTQQEMNQCAQENYQTSDEILNQVYQNVQSALTSTAAKESLTSVEQAWIDFRDHNCITFEQLQVQGGSIAPLILNSCLEQLTDERIDELQAPDIPDVSFEAADQDLNDSYQKLQSLLDDQAKTALITAQRSWLVYRDRNCAFEANHSNTVISETQCLARMTQIRTYQLQNQVEKWSL